MLLWTALKTPGFEIKLRFFGCEALLQVLRSTRRCLLITWIIVGLKLNLLELKGEICGAFKENPRRISPNKLFEERAELREKAFAVESARLSKVEILKTDPLEFFRQVLGVEPTDYQKELIELFQKNQFIAARWSRQSGKSFTTSGIFAQLCA